MVVRNSNSFMEMIGIFLTLIIHLILIFFVIKIGTFIFLPKISFLLHVTFSSTYYSVLHQIIQLNVTSLPVVFELTSKIFQFSKHTNLFCPYNEIHCIDIN